MAAAKDNYVFVSISFSERIGNAIYMGQAIIGPDGEVLISRQKLRPSGGERNIWSDGTIDQLKVVNTTYGRIGTLECWEWVFKQFTSFPVLTINRHFHPSMTFIMQAQLESIHVGSWPYMPNYNTSDALYWESAEVNMAAASMYATNSGAWTLVPVVGRAAIFDPTGLEVAHINAEVSYNDEPMLYHSINTTKFTRSPYNLNGEQSWGILQQIVNGWPAELPKENGTYIDRKTNTVSELVAKMV